MKNKTIRKFLATILLVIMIALTFVGCTTQATTEEDSDNAECSMFVYVESTLIYDIVYHKDTKVMYAISRGSYNQGTFTVMLNVDGTPMVYEGK